MASTKLQPKQVNYLNKNFNNFKSDLVEYAKAYFPNSYADFNEASPGMMFIEMASYVGDVLSFYVDEQFRESLLAYAEEKKTIYDIAQSYGYKPTIATPSTTKLDFFQTVPATGTGDGAKPNYDYAYTINAGSLVESSQYSKTFRTLDQINFAFSSSLDPTTIEIYDINDSSPTKFLLKKSVRAVSGTITTEQFAFSTAKAYDRISLSNKGVLEVISVIDSNGNKWHEVESLAQDLIFESIANTATNDPNLAGYNDTTPYLLKQTRTNNRFKTRITIEGKTQLQFGSGTSNSSDEEIIPNPSQVGSSFTNTNYLNNAAALDPSNFLNTSVYGTAPSNTTLTIQYSYGGGIEANVPAGSITSLSGIDKTVAASGLDAGLLGETEASLAVTNSIPATGGRGEETLIEIKENTKQYFQAQNRAVSKEDYITRIYNLPAKYGNIQKVYITQDDQLEVGQGIIQDGIIDMPTLEKLGGEVSIADLVGEAGRVKNPMALNFYVLGYDHNKKLTQVNEATKRNIKSYLGPYRILTDAINIKDAYVINLSVRFAMYVKKGHNKNEILLKCIQKVKDYFDIDRWQVNQPIILQDIAYQISLVEGVNNVVPPLDDNPDKDTIVITNKFKKENGYSGNIYNVKAATSKDILYPSLDPSIFEVRFPNIDIVGKVLGDY
jgi:hypothetical protein